MNVVPGPIRGGQCPPPREIVVVDARKVFDFCAQQDLLERCFFVPDLSAGARVLECAISDVTCEEILDREPLNNGDGRAIVSIQIRLTLTITIMPGMGQSPIMVRRTITFPKRVVLCAPPGTEVTCDVQGTCICTVQPTAADAGEAEPNICCTIQLCVTLTVTANVKVLIPSLGTVMPNECPSAASPTGCPPIPPECEGPVGRIMNRNC